MKDSYESRITILGSRWLPIILVRSSESRPIKLLKVGIMERVVMRLLQRALVVGAIKILGDNDGVFAWALFGLDTHWTDVAWGQIGLGLKAWEFILKWLWGGPLPGRLVDVVSVGSCQRSACGEQWLHLFHLWDCQRALLDIRVGVF